MNYENAEEVNLDVIRSCSPASPDQMLALAAAECVDNFDERNSSERKPLFQPRSPSSKSASRSLFKKKRKHSSAKNDDNEQQYEQLLQHIDNNEPAMTPVADNGTPVEGSSAAAEAITGASKSTLHTANTGRSMSHRITDRDTNRSRDEEEEKRSQRRTTRSHNTPNRHNSDNRQMTLSTVRGSQRRSFGHGIHGFYFEPSLDLECLFDVDKLVWYQDIEKLLPQTNCGQLQYGLLNLIFSPDLYYAFHRFNFDREFKDVKRMDLFFASRRALTILQVVPDALPLQIWYEIVKYETTPYKSMCFYQYIRQKDADKIYKLPVVFGYLQFILLAILTFAGCSVIDDKEPFFNFGVSIFRAGVTFEDWLIFKPWNHSVNIVAFALIIVTLLHVGAISCVWRITWFLHYKVLDWKERCDRYLARHRSKEKEEIRNSQIGAKHVKGSAQDSDRVYYKINPQSYLHSARNGELFIALLKWLNLVEHEQDLDFLVHSKKSWCVITFGLHKYIGVLVFALMVLFGLNLVMLLVVVLYVLSYWIHIQEIYNLDISHSLAASGSKQGGYDAMLAQKDEHSFLTTVKTTLKSLLWPGFLFYMVFGYVIYVSIYRSNFFPVIWLGIMPMWLIMYSVFTRGYRRVFIYNSLALFMFYFASLCWYLFRFTFTHNVVFSVVNQWVFRYFAACFLVAAAFCFHVALQLELHRALLFPQIYREYIHDEYAQRKFPQEEDGAKHWAFAQYAALYFKKKSVNYGRLQSLHSLKHKVNQTMLEFEHDKDEHDSEENKWYRRWYVRRPLDAFKVAKPRFTFMSSMYK